MPPPDPDAVSSTRRSWETTAPSSSAFRRILTQNDFAFTYMVDWDGRPESLRGIEQTIYAAAYEASSVASPRVLVVGRRRRLRHPHRPALRRRARSPASRSTAPRSTSLTRVYRDYFRRLVRATRGCGSSRTRGVTTSRRTPDRYDVLQLSGVDSYSGTPGAAHVFSESYLYTAEAFDLYLSRLTEDGILNIMRLEHQPAREMLRALVTAVGALRRAGVAAPAEHIADGDGALRQLHRPAREEDPFHRRRERAAWPAGRTPAPTSASPPLPSVNAPARGFYQALPRPAATRRRSGPSSPPTRSTSRPATDDRPFFFKFALLVAPLPARSRPSAPACR